MHQNELTPIINLILGQWCCISKKIGCKHPCHTVELSAPDVNSDPNTKDIASEYTYVHV